MERDGSDQPLAEKISEDIASEAFTAISPAVQTHVKYCILDSIGVMIGGTELPQASVIKAFWQEQGGTEDATVILSEEKYPITTGVYINSYLSNILDFDDTYSRNAIGHPGGTIIPPALAIGEQRDLDGMAVLESIAVGYEVSTAIGDAIAPSPERARYVSGINTWQIFGSTITAAHLLGLPEDAIADALGIAGVNAPVPSVRKFGIQEDNVQWMKNNFGWTAMGGVKAALLAERGFKGNHTIFDGEKGFWRMAASDTFDPTKIENIGNEHRVLDVSFKPYSACRWSHAALDCVEKLSSKIGVADLEKIESIRIETFYEATKLDSYPDSIFDAQFSLPYVVAVSLCGYTSGFEWLSQDRIESTGVRELASKVEIVESERMTENYESRSGMESKVTVTFTSGQTLVASTPHAKGSPESRMAHAELEEKFSRLTEPLLGKEQSQELKERILQIEEEDSIRDFCSLLQE